METTLNLVSEVAACNIVLSGSKVKLIQLHDSKNLSQVLRSNSGHYWEIVLLFLNDYFPKEVMQKGFILGDAHLGNFGPVDFGDRLVWLPNDLDDGGEGYLLWDFIQLMVKTKAISKEVKYQEMWNAYLSGLKGQRMTIPAEIKEFVKANYPKYLAKLGAYTERKTEDGKFILKPGEVEKLPAKVWGLTSAEVQAEIQKIFSGSSILDLSTRPKDRGGSAGSLRVWSLVQHGDRQKIYETKEIQDAAIEKVMPQANARTRITNLMRQFWGIDSSSEYGFVELAGHLMFQRPKKVDLFDVPYGSTAKADLALLSALATWDSYVMGRMHSGQPNSPAYLAGLSENSDAVLLKAKAFSKAYLKTVNTAYQDSGN